MPPQHDVKLDKQTRTQHSYSAFGQKRIMIAQGEKRQAEGKAETHTGTETEAEPPPGELPAPGLLLWNSLVVALLMVAFALFARRSLQRIPRGMSLQNLGEYIVEAMNGFTTGIIGPGGERYTPLVGTIFLYILLSNLWGLLPGFHAPTANLSLTLALGVIVFVYVQYEGMRQNGVGGHLRHFMGPSLMGKFPELFWLMGPIELISEVVKPFTLAIRLFGNIFGEDVIIIVLTGLAFQLTGSAFFGLLPIQFPVLLLSLLTAGVQALVFSMLTCIYISLVSHHDHAGPHGEEGAIDDGHHSHGNDPGYNYPVA